MIIGGIYPSAPLRQTIHATVTLSVLPLPVKLILGNTIILLGGF